jgi:hypothetical protein
LGIAPRPSALYFRLYSSAQLPCVNRLTHSASLLVECLEHLGTLSRTRVSDIQLVLERVDILSRSTDIILIVARFGIVIVGSEEEMNRGRLDFGIWVEDGQCDDRDSLGVVPDPLFPKFSHHHDCPHGLSTLLLAFAFALVADDFGAHAAFDHTEQETLDDSVQSVVLCLGIGSLEIGEDG